MRPGSYAPRGVPPQFDLNPLPEEDAVAKPQDEFLAKMKAQFEELNRKWISERSRLEEGIQHVSSEARKKYEAEWETLDQLRRQMKEKLIDLEVASENAWDDFKDGAGDAWGDVREGTEAAWQALRDGFKKAASRFK